MPSKKIVQVTFSRSVHHSPNLIAPTRKHLKRASASLKNVCDELSDALDKRKKLHSQFDDAFKIIAIANALEQAMQLQEIVNKVCSTYEKR
jgi:hypothetical protein